MNLNQLLILLYNGETSVAQNGLNKFLETAKELKVKGLQSTTPNGSDQLKLSEPTLLNVHKLAGTENTDEMEIKVLSEPVFELLNTDENVSSFEIETEAYSKDLQEDMTTHQLNLQLEQMIEKSEGLWKCKVCGKTAKRQVIQNHAEIHISGISHSCQFCNKTCKTRNSLNVHMHRNHSQAH